MRQFKEYKNLYNVYRHIVRKIRAAFLILFTLFIASFIFSIHHTSDTTIGMAVITFIFWFFSGIVCLVIPLGIEMTCAEFDPMALNRINEALPKIKMQEGFGVTQDAIVVVGFVRLDLIPIKDVLWIYKNCYEFRV